MRAAEKVAEAHLTSLMPLRKPLAKWSIRFTFGAGVVVVALDALGRSPSIEVLNFLEHIINVTAVPVIGYILTSTIEAVAKTLKGEPEESKGQGAQMEHEKEVGEYEERYEDPGDGYCDLAPRGSGRVRGANPPPRKYPSRD